MPDPITITVSPGQECLVATAEGSFFIRSHEGHTRTVKFFTQRPQAEAAPVAPPAIADVDAVERLISVFQHGDDSKAGMHAVLDEVRLNAHIYLPGIFAKWAAEVNAVRAEGKAALAEMTAKRDAAIAAMNDVVSKVNRIRDDRDLASAACAEKQAAIEKFLDGERAADAEIARLKAELARKDEALAAAHRRKAQVDEAHKRALHALDVLGCEIARLASA